MLLKVVYRPELFACIYSKFLELFSYVDNENTRIIHFDAGLSTLLISHSIQRNVSSLFTAMMKVEYVDFVRGCSLLQVHFQIETPDSLLLFNESPVVIDESILVRVFCKYLFAAR